MLDTKHQLSRPPLSEPVDLLLADVAIRIQLNRTDYAKAEQRYHTLGDHIDRKGSPLEGQVQLVYPHGSMAVGATIASKTTTDEHDVDFIAQLALPRDSNPTYVLDLLFESIRGEKGSRYYAMTTRQTRCVTVTYADKMHADIMPMVRLFERPDRISHLFHSKPEDSQVEDQIRIANPWGFAEWFKANTPLDYDFARLFEERAAAYERMILAEKAESELLPQQQPPHRKSKAVIVLQLLKRWRNIRYDDRDTRKPPSIMIARLIADTANTTDTLSEELLHQARAMLAEFRACQAEHRPIYVENPTCRDDVLTDRWPGTLHAQQVFIRDLEDLVIKVERLVGGCSLAEMRIIMADLFGEAPTEQAFRDFNHRIGHAVRDGHSYHVPGTGRLSVPASGVLAGETALAQARATPRHNFFGTEQLHW